MTNDGKNIYQSDGTEKIWTTNPENQQMLDYINVLGKTKIKALMSWSTSTVNFMQMFGKRCHCSC
jgi:glutamine cyclotransferase